MKLSVKIKEKKVEISLKGKNIIDKTVFPLSHNLSEKLLPLIAEILQKNGFTARDVEKAELFSDIKDSYTSYRIAKSVVNSLNWAKKAAKRAY